mgnify:FL=1
MLKMSHDGKLKDLKDRIREKERLLISYSGGVDSSLLAKLAHDVLGEGAVAVILDSEIYPRSELEEAVAMAESLGLELRVERFSILDDQAFSQNPSTRCYICKKRSSAILKRVAQKEGMSCIADGVNADDLDDYRPGIAACSEEGIWHPFVDSGITKKDIRTLAQDMGLPVWDKPSSACLASRIPYNERITREGLRMVEEGEEYLKSLGFGQLRVRSQGKTARIELEEQELERALACRQEIVMRLKCIGFEYVTLDLEGYRSGSLNEVL